MTYIYKFWIRKNKFLEFLRSIMVDSDKKRMMKSQIRKQKKLIKKLKNIIKMYAPYMEFTEEFDEKHHGSR